MRMNDIILNAELIDFVKKYLIESPQSIIPCSVIYQKYKNFCKKFLSYPIRYKDFRAQITEIKPNLECKRVGQRFCLINVRYKGNEDV